MTEIDLFFYMFGLISLILILMIIFILNKSRNIANWLFIMTPALFTLILIFNMINYYGDIINDFLLWFPYLLAPLGMLLSSIYILRGPGFHKNTYLQLSIGLYVLLSILFSSYPKPLEYSQMSNAQQGLMHLYLIIPFIVTIYCFKKIASEIPEQKQKIYFLITGLILVCLGSLARSIEYIVYNQDSTIGMVIIVVGSILTLLAFAGVGQHKAEQTN